MRAVVIGAGVVGLSCAWFLQEEGVEVTVLDRDDVGAGASWGNAGWLSPSLTVPLPDPNVLREGVRGLFDPRSPLVIPPRLDPDLWRFLLRFARHCTTRASRDGMAGYREVNAQALDAYDALADGTSGLAVSTPAAILAAFAAERDAAGLLAELRLVAGSGQPVDVEMLTADEARAREPLLSEAVALAVSIGGQRYIDPGRFVGALGDAVRGRGAEVIGGTTVRAVRATASGVAVDRAGAPALTADAAVVAAGAWTPALVRPHGVQTDVRSGRGYSVSVATEPPPAGPIYFPAARVACTPLGGRLRIAGMMEFRGPDDPLDERRLAVIEQATRPLLQGVDWSSRTDEWVGPRPVTPDGLPLIGATRTRGVYVAGGHGMWGVTLGPLTGRLLARQIASGRTPPELAAFDPVR